MKMRRRRQEWPHEAGPFAGDRPPPRQGYFAPSYPDVPNLPEEEEAAAGRGEPPRGPSHGNPVTGALQVALPLQIRVQIVARRLLQPGHPQEVAADPDGFFHNETNGGGGLKFRNLSGRGAPMVDPGISFLRGYEGFKVEQCCGGLLLCKCWESLAEEDEYDLVVCNPATEKWTVVPPIVFLDEEYGDPYSLPLFTFLGFGTAIPSRFMVFAPLVGCLDSVAIYSSESGQWIRSGLEDGVVPVVTSECVFLNGFMHLIIDEPDIAVVDTNGEVWNRIPLPEERETSYGHTPVWQSQGLLHAWYIDPDEDHQLLVWVLEDYGSGNWILKHTVNVSELFDTEDEDRFYEMFAIHPERNFIFIPNRDP